MARTKKTMLNKIKETVTQVMEAKEPMKRKIAETLAHFRPNGGNGKVEHPLPALWETASDGDKELAGWVSPAYVRSRAVSLDPLLLARNRCLLYLDNAREAESFKVLRTQVLQKTKNAGAKTIMVTSALPREGKTVTAINLAIEIAREFQHTVMLVDSDLQQQSIHKYLGSGGEKGLIDHLTGGTPVSELITWPGIEKMTLISGGRLLRESAEVLGSPRMRELVPDMKARYPDRYIIFDMPSILTGADVLTLAPLVDKILVVVQAGRTSMDSVRKALQYLPQEKILGLALNRCTQRYPIRKKDERWTK